MEKENLFKWKHFGVKIILVVVQEKNNQKSYTYTALFIFDGMALEKVPNY